MVHGEGSESDKSKSDKPENASEKQQPPPKKSKKLTRGGSDDHIHHHGRPKERHHRPAKETNPTSSTTSNSISATTQTHKEPRGRFRKFLDIFPIKSVSAAPPTFAVPKPKPGLEWLHLNVKGQAYFHGMIHKDELAAMLRKDGDFILRLGRSTVAKTNVTLSVQWNGKPRHFIINRAPTKQVFVEHARRFRDEAVLVDWYKTTGTPISFAGYKLITPITKQAWELDKKDIELKEEVGKGAFGKVFRGTLLVEKGKRAEVAIKLCEMTELSLEAQNQFMKEAEIGRRYNHPNVIRVYGVQHREQPLMIVMEWAPNGSLLNLLQKHADKLSERQLLNFAREACSGLEFLAIKRVLHRDVAARNFLLGPAPEMNVKIADFGLAKADCTIYKMTSRVRLAVRWMAPEVLLHGDFSLASEVWQFGVTLWEIFTRGQEPFAKIKSKEIKERLTGVEKLRLDCPPAWGAPICDLIRSCWADRPADRPTIGKIGESLDGLLGRTVRRLFNADAFERGAPASEYENEEDADRAPDLPTASGEQMPEN